MPRLLIAFLVFAVCAAAPVRADEDEAEGDSIPAAFTPFEHMIGAWKGTGIPEANRVKGWEEKHLWAWKFVKGVPVGMSVEFQGDQALKQANLTYDEKSKQYQLVGTTPEDKEVTYLGALGSNGKALVLERKGDKEGNDRITIRPNSNKIRYQVNFDHQPPGAPAYKKVVTVGLTKEGESFAAGGSSSNLPKCIITGGSATMSVSFEGKSYPICCSGCRDEFTDNPTKYVKKALLRAAAGGKGGAAVKSASSSSNDSEFDGLLGGASKAAPSRSMSKSRAPKSTPPKTSKNEKAEDPEAAEPTEPEAEDDGAAAASLLKQAEKVEKRSKIAAKILYQRLLKDYPDSDEAKTAKARLKAIGG